jgi:hypothetical protein
MFKWIFLFVLILSGLGLGFFYLQIQKLENDPTKLPPVEGRETVTIAHAYRDGAHQFGGYIYLPNSCHQVSARVLRDQKVLEKMELRVETKDMQTQTAFCSMLRTRYYFNALEEGPKDIRFSFKLNGKEHDHRLVESTAMGVGATLEMPMQTTGATTP